MSYAWDAQRWGALPEAGGLRDQVAGDLLRMRAALNVYNAVRQWHMLFLNAPWDELQTWMREHAEQWRIVQEWIRLKDGRL